MLKNWTTSRCGKTMDQNDFSPLVSLSQTGKNIAIICRVRMPSFKSLPQDISLSANLKHSTKKVLNKSKTIPSFTCNSSRCLVCQSAASQNFLWAHGMWFSRRYPTAIASFDKGKDYRRLAAVDFWQFPWRIDKCWDESCDVGRLRQNKHRFFFEKTQEPLRSLCVKWPRSYANH